MGCLSWLGGDGEAFPLYLFIKGGFRLSTLIFYGNISCDEDATNIPSVGEPTLLCFNHMNGLTDPMVMMRACPRMVRFIAMDSLWKMPILGWLVRGAAAVAVKRPKDHGGNVDQHNAQEGVLRAWDEGHMVGVSPEGGSCMRTMVKTPFKKGYLFWLVDAAFNHWDDDGFKIHVVPCGLTFLHPWSWRSDVVVRYGKRFDVDVSFLKKHGATEEMSKSSATDKKRLACAQRCVETLVKQVELGMIEVTINIQPPPCPSPVSIIEGDWAAVRNGITAARICHPEGAQLIPIRKWIGYICHFARELQRAENESLEAQVREYQSGLSRTGLLDALVSRVAQAGRPSACALLCGIGLRAAQSLLYFVCGLPGALFWSPIWLLCIVSECYLVGRGRTVKDGVVMRRGSNFDLIASAKMFIGFIGLTLECIASGVSMLLWFPPLHGSPLWIRFLSGLLVACGLFPLFMYATMRLHENGVAAFRAAHARSALLRAPAAALEALVHRRTQLAALLLPLEGKLPRTESQVGAVPPRRWWLHRSKEDWHESFFPEDLTWSGLVDDTDRTGATGLTTPLLARNLLPET